MKNNLRAYLSMLLVLSMLASVFIIGPVPVKAATITPMDAEGTIVNLNPGCHYCSGVNSDLTGGSLVNFYSGQRVKVLSKADHGSWFTYYCVSDAGGGYVAGKYVELIPEAPKPEPVNPAEEEIAFEADEKLFDNLKTASDSITSKSSAWAGVRKGIDRFSEAMLANYRKFLDYAEEHRENAEAVADKFQKASDSLFGALKKALNSVSKLSALSKKNKERVKNVISEVDKLQASLPAFRELIPKEKEDVAEDPAQEIVAPFVPNLCSVIGWKQEYSYGSGLCTMVAATVLMRLKAYYDNVIDYTRIDFGYVNYVNGGSRYPDASNGKYPVGTGITWAKTYNLTEIGASFTTGYVCNSAMKNRDYIAQLLREHPTGAILYSRYGDGGVHAITAFLDESGNIMAYDGVTQKITGNPYPVRIENTWLAQRYSDVNQLYSNLITVIYITSASYY